MLIFTPLNFFKRNIKGFECEFFMRTLCITCLEIKKKGIRVESCVHMVVYQVSSLVHKYAKYWKKSINQKQVKSWNNPKHICTIETIKDHRGFTKWVLLFFYWLFRWSTQASHLCRLTQRTVTWYRTVWRRENTQEKWPPQTSKSSSSQRMPRKSCSREWHQSPVTLVAQFTVNSVHLNLLSTL